MTATREHLPQNPAKRVLPVDLLCTECGGHEFSFPAIATWDRVQQTFVVIDASDGLTRACCRGCGGNEALMIPMTEPS